MKNGLEINKYGDKFWYRNRTFHRDDGPAAEYIDGSKWWYKNGIRHRNDGPAIEYVNGNKSYYCELPRPKGRGFCRNFQQGLFQASKC